jgi:hypothetical protein
MDVATLAAAAALAEFDAAMARIGFAQAQRDAIIESSGCRNMAMIRLLTADQVSRYVKELALERITPFQLRRFRNSFCCYAILGCCKTTPSTSNST